MNKQLFLTTYGIAAATVLVGFAGVVFSAFGSFDVMPWYTLLQIFLMVAPIAFAYAHAVYLACIKNPTGLPPSKAWIHMLIMTSVVVTLPTRLLYNGEDFGNYLALIVMTLVWVMVFIVFVRALK